MINPIYEHTLMAGWVALLLFGVCLLLCHVPQKPVFKVYNRSRKLTAAVMLIFGTQLLLHWIFFFRIHTPYVATALNLTGFHIEGILFGMSQISLLNNRYISRRQMRRDISLCLLTCIVAWPSALLLEGEAQRVGMVIAALIFFGHACHMALVFLHTYRRALQWLDDYFSESVEVFVKWQYRCTIGFICYSLPGALLAFCPQTYNTVYMLFIIVLFTYIFISFHNYSINYTEVESVVAPASTVQADSPACDPPHPAEEPGQADTGETPDTAQNENRYIRQQIDLWIQREGYRQKGITIDSLIDLLHINRTYISNFINTTYRCNFREWVTTLRMDYAKRLLADRSDKTIETVSEMAGFSSSSYFCKQFTRREGMTPSAWRKQEQEAN